MLHQGRIFISTYVHNNENNYKYKNHVLKQKACTSQGYNRYDLFEQWMYRISSIFFAEKNELGNLIIKELETLFRKHFH